MASSTQSGGAGRTEYKEHEFSIERVDVSYRRGYEIFAIVDGERVKSATQLERDGIPGPEDGGAGWHTSLKMYAKAYIDGLHAAD